MEKQTRPGVSGEYERVEPGVVRRVRPLELGQKVARIAQRGRAAAPPSGPKAPSLMVKHSKPSTACRARCHSGEADKSSRAESMAASNEKYRKQYSLAWDGSNDEAIYFCHAFPS